MKTATKPEITQQQAVQLVQHHFGSNTTIEQFTELSDGWFNAGYLLTLSDGQEMVLKIAPSTDMPMLRYEKDIIQSEVELMQLIKHNTTLPIPAFLATDLSRTQLPNDYYFLEKLSGTPLDKVEKQISQHAMAVIQQEKGQFLAGLHQLKGNSYGYPVEKGLPQTTSWKSAFEHMIENILKDASDYKVKLPFSIERVQHIINQNLSLLESITEPALLHFDFWNGNIFVNDKTGEVHLEGVIDFERGMWGDPLAEFVVDLNIHPDDLEESAMFHAYQQAAPRPLVIDKDSKRRIRLYKAYLGLIMVVECAPRQYPLPMRTWIKTWVFNNLKQNLKELER